MDGRTNKSLHLCINEAHLAAQLVPPMHTYCTDYRLHSTHVDGENASSSASYESSQVGWVIVPGPGSQLGGSEEYNCYAEFLYACALARYCLLSHLPTTGTFLSASHLWSVRRQRERANYHEFI